VEERTEEKMSQRSVEQVIGRLATDEELRRRFERNREAVIAEMVASGLVLTAVEQRALLEVDFSACKRFARCLDPRIQKVSLKRRLS
jgi:hypothetical protein